MSQSPPGLWEDGPNTAVIEVRIHHNTAIAAIMELVNAIAGLKADDETSRALRWQALGIAVQLLYPFAPHLGEEVWERMGNKEHLTFHPWPEYDHELAAEEMLTVVVQVNGKLRGRIEVPTGTGEEEVKAAALEDERVQRFVEGKTVRKTIYVPDKLLNIVVS